MRTRSTSLASAGALALLTACSTTPPGGNPHAVRPLRNLAAAPADAVFAGSPAANAADAPVALALAPVAPKYMFGTSGYTRLRFGSFTPAGDIDFLDTGVYGEVAFGQNVLPFLAVDVSIGYLSTTGPGNSDLSALPVFLNGRLQLPILVFEVYGGLGIGGLYADYEFSGIGDSEFLMAGSAFAGLEAGLGNLGVGIEYRYLKSEETKLGFEIEGHGLLLFATLPF